MFKKLRNDFIRLNVIIISLVMLLAFTAVYLTVSYTVQKDNQAKLNLAVSSGQLGQGSVAAQGGEFYGNNEQITSLSFSVLVDSHSTLQNQGNMLPISTEYAKKLVAQIQSSDNGKVTVGERKFIYRKTPWFSGNTVIIGQENNSSVIQEVAPQDSEISQITFVDITDSEKIISTLLLVFCISGVSLFAVILLVSIFFANRSIKPIRQAWEKQERFVADASHELKTPTAIISANNEALLQSIQNPEEVRKWSANIEKETDRMSSLIQNLLDFTKLKSTFHDDEMIEFNLSSAVNDEIISMEALIYEKNIMLTQNIENQVLLKASQEKITRVVRILLDNAIKYCDETGSIDITLKKQRNHILFLISNTGTIIPPDALPHVFDRFYKVDSSRKYDGSFGLGLAMAKEIIDYYKGSVSVQSSPAHGTTFSITL